MSHEDESQMKVSRRAFVGLVSAGAVAALAGDAASAPAKKRTAAAKAAPAQPKVIRDGIAAQKKSLAAGLEKLRAHKVDSDVWPAFGFRPIKSSRPR